MQIDNHAINRQWVPTNPRDIENVARPDTTLVRADLSSLGYNQLQHDNDTRSNKEYTMQIHA